MKYRFTLSLILCCLFLSCSKNEQPEYRVIIVKAPPVYDDKISKEENYWRFQHFLFPQEKIPNPIPRGLPNDDSLLIVRINADGSIKLNSEILGNISDTSPLKDRLSSIFREREKNGVYEPENLKVVKAVGVIAANSVRYTDFMDVLDATNQSRAEPIVLLYEDDARPKILIEKENK